MITDPISDMLTRIRNANTARKPLIEMPYSKMKGEIARILKNEGYIKSYELVSKAEKPTLAVELKVDEGERPIKDLQRASKPGLRSYVGAGEIPKVIGGLGICILSTSKGIMTGREAKKQNIGGELIAFVY